MNETRETRNKWLWRAGFVVFLASLFIVPEINRMMRPKGSVTNPKVVCYAKAVALHQHLYDAYGTDPATGFADWARFDQMMNEMIAYTRGLRRRDDPLAHQMRPVIARAEAARDTAVATNAEDYRSEAWSRVQQCFAEEFGESQVRTRTVDRRHAGHHVTPARTNLANGFARPAMNEVG